MSFTENKLSVSRVLKHIAAAVLLCSLTSCKQADLAESMFDRYQSRLSNALNLTLADRSTIELQEFPSRRELTIELVAQSIDILEFLELTPCQLQRLIGERNSSLGQFMSHSQRWIYEAEFIQLLQECLAYLEIHEPEDDLTQKLTQVLVDKIQQRPNVVWNALWASNEFHNLFSVASKSLEPNSQKPSELIAALQQLNKSKADWLNRKIIPSQNIEFNYQVIGSEKYLGKLLLSIKLALSRLNVLNDAMTDRLNARPLCFSQQKNRQAGVLENVFLKFYIGEVQPYLALIHQSTKPLVLELELLNVDLMDSKNSPQVVEFNRYWQSNWSVENPDSLWSRFNRAVGLHTQLWQKQLDQCGLLPK